MVGHDDVTTPGGGSPDSHVGINASITGEEQCHASVEQLIQCWYSDAMSLVGGRYVELKGWARAVCHSRRDCLEPFDQQSCGGLPVGVKVAPYGDALASCQRAPDPLDCAIHIGQLSGWGGCVLTGIQEAARDGRGGDTTPHQRSRYQGVPANRLKQRIRNGNGLGIKPVSHVRPRRAKRRAMAESIHNLLHLAPIQVDVEANFIDHPVLFVGQILGKRASDISSFT